MHLLVTFSRNCWCEIVFNHGLMWQRGQLRVSKGSIFIHEDRFRCYMLQINVRPKHIRFCLQLIFAKKVRDPLFTKKLHSKQQKMYFIAVVVIWRLIVKDQVVLRISSCFSRIQKNHFVHACAMELIFDKKICKIWFPTLEKGFHFACTDPQMIALLTLIPYLLCQYVLILHFVGIKKNKKSLEIILVN